MVLLVGHNIRTCGLYYKLMTTVNDDSRVVNKLEASFIDDPRAVIYDSHRFIIQATGGHIDNTSFYL